MHLCCAVPYRRLEDKIEFCLILSPHDRAWDFPQVEVPAEACGPDLVAEQARRQGGLQGHIDGKRPLGQYSSSRAGMHKEVTAFLMEVTAVVDDPADVTRRWCLAAEAKARIRRKPLRRLVDVAQRLLEGDT